VLQKKGAQKCKQKKCQISQASKRPLERQGGHKRKKEKRERGKIRKRTHDPEKAPIGDKKMATKVCEVNQQ